MGSRTSRKAGLFLSMNLLCYAVAITATSITTPSNSSSGPSTLGLPPSRGSSSGDSEGSDSNNSSGTNPGQQLTTCPRDAIHLGVYANLLGGLVGVVVRNPPTTPCCTILAGLVDLEVVFCLCTAIGANVLAIINLNIQVALSLLLNVCGKTVPPEFIYA